MLYPLGSYGLLLFIPLPSATTLLLMKFIQIISQAQKEKVKIELFNHTLKRRLRKSHLWEECWPFQESGLTEILLGLALATILECVSSHISGYVAAYL